SRCGKAQAFGVVGEVQLMGWSWWVVVGAGVVVVDVVVGVVVGAVVVVVVVLVVVVVGVVVVVVAAVVEVAGAGLAVTLALTFAGGSMNPRRKSGQTKNLGSGGGVVGCGGV